MSEKNGLVKNASFLMMATLFHLSNNWLSGCCPEPECYLAGNRWKTH